jgi:putative transposase
VLDWFSRRVLAWRLSITLEAEFCLDAVQEAMARHGKPEIFNTDQGSQGGFQWSSQHLDGVSCDGNTQRSLGSGGTRSAAVAWPATCGAA